MSRKLTLHEKTLKLIKRTKRANTLFMATLLTLSVLSIVLVNFLDSRLLANNASYAQGKEDGEIFRGTFVGDMMFGRYVGIAAQKQGYDYLFNSVSPYLKGSDYVFGNFENPALSGDSYKPADDKILLKSDTASLESLKKMNFTVLSLANNHTMDYGSNGLTDTITAIENNGMDYIGAGADINRAKKISYKDVNGIRIATLSLTDIIPDGFKAENAKPGVLTTSNPMEYLPLIEEARGNADLVVVSVHWGNEYDTKISERQKELAMSIADSGADIIVGQHPHVLQPIDIYKNARGKDTVIFYSLGNFIFDQPWTMTKESALIQYKLLDSGKAQIEVVPVWLDGGQPIPVSDNYKKYHKKNIVSRLTEKINGMYSFTETSDRLLLQLDQSHVLEGRSIDAE